VGAWKRGSAPAGEAAGEIDAGDVARRPPRPPPRHSTRALGVVLGCCPSQSQSCAASRALRPGKSGACTPPMLLVLVQQRNFVAVPHGEISRPWAVRRYQHAAGWEVPCLGIGSRGLCRDPGDTQARRPLRLLVQLALNLHSTVALLNSLLKKKKKIRRQHRETVLVVTTVPWTLRTSMYLRMPEQSRRIAPHRHRISQADEGFRTAYRIFQRREFHSALQLTTSQWRLNQKSTPPVRVHCTQVPCLRSTTGDFSPDTISASFPRPGRGALGLCHDLSNAYLTYRR